MARELPNVYTQINDLSALIEADDSLTIGVTLRANRGKMGEAVLVEDSSDFLTKYTYAGKPGPKQDTTYFDILELLKVTSNVWVSRAANNPLYGGLIVRKPQVVAKFAEKVEDEKGEVRAIKADKSLAGIIAVGDEVLIDGIEGRLCVTKVEAEQLTFSDKLPEFKEAGDITLAVQPLKLSDVKIADAIDKVLTEDFDGRPIKAIVIADKAAEAKILPGDQIRIGGKKIVVVSSEYTAKAYKEGEEIKAGVVVELETIEGLAAGKVEICRDSIANPEQYNFGKDELFLITGIDQGAYNSKIGIEITSSNETELEETDCFQLKVTDEREVALEEYLVSLDLAKKDTAGVRMFIKDKINEDSQYIRIITPEDELIDEEAIPASTGSRAAFLGGGSDGGDLIVDTEEGTIDYNIVALKVFASKMVPVSILVNGNNTSADYQSAMISICEERKDCFCFLRTPHTYEKMTLPAQRIKSLVNYKKNALDFPTSYVGCMFGPHAYVTDNYNSRKVLIGMDSLACKQYLKVIADKGYPYAAAGPANGKIENVTLDWKIGDDSNEAKAINEASMNFLVYEPKQKYYYLNTQNTLQLANSAFRNIGAVLNVLNMKENLAVRLKDFVQLPIDGEGNLQEEIVRNMTQYMEGCKSGGRVSNFHISDNTTKNDISNNELHFLITLAPAYYAQKIYLVVNVVNAAFDFAILQAA